MITLTELYQIFMKPLSPDEDTRRQEFILNIILSSSVLLIGILNILISYNSLRLGDSYSGISYITSLIVLLIFIGLLGLSRIGKHSLASYALISIYILATTYAISQWGPDLPTALLGYAIIVTISSILIGTRFAFIITSFVSTILILFTYLQSRLLLSPTLEWKTEVLGVYDGIAFASLLCVIMIVSWLSNREIEQSLRRARISEAALKKERDSLETKVTERTQELQQLQLQRVAELHHLAESGKMAAGFFHDLMNPLTALTLVIEELGAKPAQTKQLNHSLEKVLAASRRVGQLITAIQRQTLITTAPQLLNLNNELSYILQLLDYKARKNNITLKLEPSPTPKLIMNPTDFQRIVHNLIDFAIDATQHSSNTEQNIITIGLRTDAIENSLYVVYNGPQLTSLDNSSSQQLGLTIAQNTLLQMSCNLFIQNNSQTQTVTLRAQLPH